MDFIGYLVGIFTTFMFAAYILEVILFINFKLQTNQI